MFNGNWMSSSWFAFTFRQHVNLIVLIKILLYEDHIILVAC